MSDLFKGDGLRASYLIAPGLRMRDLYAIVYDRVDFIRPEVETDIDALCQRTCVEIEKKLGIFPNTDSRAVPPAEGWRDILSMETLTALKKRTQEAIASNQDGLDPSEALVLINALIRSRSAIPSRNDSSAVVRLLVEALETAKNGIETSATDTVWVKGSDLISETVCDHIAAALSDPRLVRLLADGETGR